MTEIEIPKNLKNVHKYINRTSPFGNYENLRKVTFEEGTVGITASVTSIYDNAFSNCSNLKWAKFAGNAPEYFGRNTSSSNIFSNSDSNFKVYYYKHNTGFTNPWYGYTTEAIDAIKTQPVSKTVTEGDSVTLTIDEVLNDNGLLTYQ